MTDTKDNNKENISGYAFTIGKQIEQLINEQSDLALSKYKLYEQKILYFYSLINNDDPLKQTYKDFFEINTINKGSIRDK